MAYAQIEPFGPLHDDLRAGRICATIASGSLKKEDGSGFMPGDFFSSLGPAPDELVIENIDPEAQSKLIMASIFGKTD